MFWIGRQSTDTRPQWFFPAKGRNGAKAEVVISGWREVRFALFCSAAAVGDSRTKARDGSKTGRISFGGTASGERRDPDHDFPMTSH